MIDTKPTAVENRIVITIDSDRLSDTTIEYAVTMAARLKRPLHGIFIEDTDLLSSAALPFTTEICSSTGQPRSFDTGSLQSAFSDIALRFRQRLAQTADKMAVRWSVSSVRGRRRDFHFDDLAESDFCIYEGGTPKRPPRPTSREKHILVIDGAGEAFYQTLAALLAPLEGNQLHVTLVQTAGEEGIADIATRLPTGTLIEHLDVQYLATTLQQSGDRFDYVVVSRRRWLANLAPLLAHLGCPLIVVG